MTTPESILEAAREAHAKAMTAAKKLAGRERLTAIKWANNAYLRALGEAARITHSRQN
jgi:hypothetical protein